MSSSTRNIILSKLRFYLVARKRTRKKWGHFFTSQFVWKISRFLSWIQDRGDTIFLFLSCYHFRPFRDVKCNEILARPSARNLRSRNEPLVLEQFVRAFVKSNFKTLFGNEIRKKWIFDALTLMGRISSVNRLQLTFWAFLTKFP